MFKPSDEELEALHKCCENLLFLQNVFSGHDIWKNLGFEGYDERLMAVFGCLFLIRDTNYQTGDCFERDLQTGMYDFMTNTMHKDVSFENACRLTTHIMMEVLQNHGKPFKRSLTNLTNVNYINFMKKLNPDGEKKYSYHLEMSMEEYLFLNSGAKRYLDIDIQQIIFNERITQKDYKNAVDDAVLMYRGLLANTNYLNQESERQKRNSYDYDYQKFDQVIKKRKDTIQQTIDKFLGYKAKIKADIEQLEGLEFQRNYQKLSATQKENLAYQEKIQKTLDRCLHLLYENYDIYSEYSQNIENSFAEQLKQLCNDEEYFSFNEVYQTVLSRGEALLDGSFMNFISPLFLKRPLIIYNPELALQEVYSREKKEHPEFDNQDVFRWNPAEDELEKERSQQAQLEKEEPYRQLLAILLLKLAECQELSFADMDELLDSEEERNLFYQHKEIFKEMVFNFVILAMDSTVLDVSAEHKRYGKMKFITGTSVDMIKIIIEILTEHPKLSTIKRIRFETDLNDKVNLFGLGFNYPILIVD